MNIVAIDNNQQSLSLLVDTLSAIAPPCHIQSFTDPLMSAKYICNSPVDMVILAETMRPVDGFVLLHALRANRPDLPYIMLSEDGLRNHEATLACISGYFTKPLSADVLLKISDEIRKNQPQ